MVPAKQNHLYLFLGEEDFLKEKKIEEFKKKFLEKSTFSMNYNIFHGDDKAFSSKEMLDALNTTPFLGEKRLVVLKKSQLLKAGDKDKILSYISNINESSIFIIETDFSVIKDKFLLSLSKEAHLVYFRRLTDIELTNWIIKKSSFYKKKITKDAVMFIKENLPNALRLISSNMDNIILYKGKEDIISKKDVEIVLGGQSSLHTVFELIDYIILKNIKKAFLVFSSFNKDKKKEIEFLGLLGWNMRMILRVKELLRIKNRFDISKELKIHPRMCDRIIKQAQRLKKSKLTSCLDSMLVADRNIKSGRGIASLEVEKLIVKMCV